MVEKHRFRLVDFLLLVVVLAVAGGLRADYLLTCADAGRNAGPLVVAAPAPMAPDSSPDEPVTELDRLIRNLRERQWFACRAPLAAADEPTAHVAPGYPSLLALLASFVDASVLDSTIRWIQCGLGTLTAGLYYLFARRLFGLRSVATLAGLFAAAHPFWVVDTAAIQDGVLTTFLVALALQLGARSHQVNGPITSLLLGLVLAGMALVRATLLPLAFLLLCWFLLRCRNQARGWLYALLAFLGFVNGLAPWTFRNWQTFGEPLPIVDSTYLHLWIGNNPQATGGPETAAMRKTAPVEELSKITPQTNRYNRLGDLVVEEIRSHPAETVRRRLWAGLAFLFGERWLTEGRLAERLPDQTMPPWLESSYESILQGTLLGLTLLGLLGWRWTFGWRGSELLALPTLWIPLPYVLGHAEALSGPRLPLDGVLLCYAAFALSWFSPGVRQQLRRHVYDAGDDIR
jgi:4-amino-4-deoxy-L-arabinose transferase-like glycosyltransferase